jgi:hypothetical protein
VRILTTNETDAQENVRCSVMRLARGLSAAGWMKVIICSTPTTLLDDLREMGCVNHSTEENRIGYLPKEQLQQHPSISDVSQKKI